MVEQSDRVVSDVLLISQSSYNKTDVFWIFVLLGGKVRGPFVHKFKIHFYRRLEETHCVLLCCT